MQTNIIKGVWLVVVGVSRGERTRPRICHNYLAHIAKYILTNICTKNIFKYKQKYCQGAWLWWV